MEAVVELLQVLEGATYAAFIAGAIFAVWQLYEMRRDRATQLVLNMMEAVSSREMQEMVRPIEDGEFRDAKEAEEKCGRVALYAVCGYHEGLGYLVQRGLIDRNTVFEGLGISETWEAVKPWVLKERERCGPAYFDNFEHAAEMERAYEAKKNRKGV